MHDGGPHLGLVVPVDENISGTIDAANGEDLPESPLGCVFIEPDIWPAGFPPFCGRPVLAGSPYCRAHAARCAAPATETRR